MSTTFVNACVEVAKTYATFQSAFKRLRPQFGGVPETDIVRIAQEVSKSISAPQVAEKRGRGRPRKEVALPSTNFLRLPTTQLEPRDVLKDPLPKQFVSMDNTSTGILRVLQTRFSSRDFMASEVAEFLRYERTQTLVMAFRGLVSNGYLEIVTPRGTGTYNVNVYRLTNKALLGSSWLRVSGFDWGITMFPTALLRLRSSSFLRRCVFFSFPASQTTLGDTWSWPRT